MIQQSDIERLVKAERRIRKELFPVSRQFLSSRRKAARILCEELRWLSDERPDFWQALQAGSAQLSQYQKTQQELFKDIRSLIDLEIGAFAKLGISEKDSSGPLEWVYNALDIVQDQNTVVTS